MGRVVLKLAMWRELILGCAVALTFHSLWAVTRSHQSTPQRTTGAQIISADSQRLYEEIGDVEALLPALPDRGAALFVLAHHHARLGHKDKALTLLKECVGRDQGFNPLGVKAFELLMKDPEFRNLVQLVRQLYPPVHRGRVAFRVGQKDLFPEGLAVDASQRVFYMGSMYHNKIVRINKNGDVSEFVKEGAHDLMPVGGVHVDPNDHSVWCATDPGDKNRSEIVHFDAQGKLLERYAAPGAGPHDLNDLVLRGRAEIYVTDTDGNRVYRFDRESHAFAQVALGRPVFYPNGITLSDDGEVLYVADSLGIIRLNLRTNEAHDVKPSTHDTMAGVDGLYWYKGGLVGVQYGTGAFRVMWWKLSSSGGEIVFSQILERGTKLVMDPTTGAILEGRFYFMANTGIDNLNSGRIVDPGKLQPLRIAVVPLP